MAPRRAVVCLVWCRLIFALNQEACRNALAKFSAANVAKMNDVDLAIARLRLAPYYRERCPRMTREWDGVEERLERRRSELRE